MSLFSFGHHEEIPKNKQIQDLPLTQIKPNRYQPRQSFSEESIQELAQTLQKDGLLQPIIVRQSGQNYEIIAGERRFRAAQSLGWTTIPAIVNNMSDDQAASLALIENLQREDLNPIEEARAYQQLMKLNHFTQAQLAQEMGKSQSSVANHLRLLRLTPKVQSYLINGSISARHGRALVGLSPHDQERVLREILVKNLNVQETEAIATDVDTYFKQKAAAQRKKQRPAKQRRIVQHLPRDLQMQINTIKKAVKLARASGIQVKVHEEKKPNDYKISIEMKRK